MGGHRTNQPLRTRAVSWSPDQSRAVGWSQDQSSWSPRARWWVCQTNLLSTQHRVLPFCGKHAPTGSAVARQDSVCLTRASPEAEPPPQRSVRFTGISLHVMPGPHLQVGGPLAQHLQRCRGHYGYTSPRLHVSQIARLCGTHRLHATTAARLHDGTSLRRHVSARVRRASPGPGQLIGGRPVSTERRPSHR